MPPVMLTTDEAVAITLALALTGTPGEPVPAQTALEKLLHGPVAEVEPWVPRFLGVCEPVGAAITRVRSSTSNPDYFVLRISDHPFAMTVEEPDAVREAFARAAERFAAAATVS
jgi:predicted DNA-binding transcriptional regulator YafY